MNNLVSIVCISYNNEKYVEYCLNSILNQTYSEIELIVADDCSKDATFEIIQNWCIEHKDRFASCIYYRNINNLGICGNCNTALEKVSGDYIKFVAADDILLPEGISDLYNCIKSRKADIVYSDALVMGDEDTYPLNGKFSNFYESIIPHEGRGQKIFDKLYENNFVCAPSVMFAKKTFEQFGRYSLKYKFEDWEYWLRLIKEGGEIAFLNKRTVGYRVSNSSASHFGRGVDEENRFVIYFTSMENMLEEYKSYYSKKSMTRFYIKFLIFSIRKRYIKKLPYIIYKLVVSF